jgi:hypothetical protein
VLPLSISSSSHRQDNILKTLGNEFVKIGC